MTRKNYIEITVTVDYDSSHAEQTENGVQLGREITEVVRVPIEDAVDIVQSQVGKLDYYRAREFVKKYREK